MVAATKNFFEQAAPATAKGKAKAKTHFVPVEGLEMVASLKVVQEAVSALSEVYEGEVKVYMNETFVSQGASLHRRPDNFHGEEGEADASLQLRKRSTVSKLGEAEVTALTDHGIPFQTVADSFQINPKYVEDAALMKKINSALVKVTGIPDDFFEVVAGKCVATEESVETVFQKSRTVIAELLPMVTVLGIKAKLKTHTEESIRRAFGRVSDALGQDLTKADARKARAEKLPGYARAKKTKPVFSGE
jgi:uncharacterized protein YbjQ (UPF0145 family)/uncharacterized protein YlzI (FlbEa/FlbD family)